jgi:hypothetical protein
MKIRTKTNPRQLTVAGIALLSLGVASICLAQTSTPAAKSSTPSTKTTPANAKSTPAPAATSPAAAMTTPATTSAASPATASSPAARTDVYHVHFVKAAAGKAVQLAGARDLRDWHNDTFVNGPSWADFTKAMGLGDDSSKSAGSVYVVSVYRPITGHDDQLEKFLSEPPVRPTDTSAGNVLMQHLEGGPWRFLTIARYASWADYGTNETNSVAQTSKNEGGWFTLRDHTSFHTDTLTNRIAP